MRHASGIKVCTLLFKTRVDQLWLGELEINHLLLGFSMILGLFGFEIFNVQVKGARFDFYISSKR